MGNNNGIVCLELELQVELEELWMKIKKLVKG